MAGIGRHVYTLRASRISRLLGDRPLIRVIASRQKQQRQGEYESFAPQDPCSVSLNILIATPDPPTGLGNFQAYFSRNYDANRQRILHALRFIDG